MSHTTPTPTVFEEARKLAAAMYGADTVSASCVESGDWDETPIVQAFIAAIELGERRGRIGDSDLKDFGK